MKIDFIVLVVREKPLLMRLARYLVLSLNTKAHLHSFTK